METEELLTQIETAFPIMAMPPLEAIVAHDDKCPECRGLTKDLERYKDAPINGDAIRLLHQQLYHLSSPGLHWILPYYLRYCLTSEAIYNRFETEFLIYSFAPLPQYYEDAVSRLSGIDLVQARCLWSFFDWCLSDPDWRSSYGQEISLAMSFLADNWDISPK